MRVLAEHEFIENEKGQIALVFDRYDELEPDEPALLIHPTAGHGYLRRQGVELSRVEGINPNVLDALRRIKSILMIEMDGEEIASSYDVPVGLVPMEE